MTNNFKEKKVKTMNKKTKVDLPDWWNDITFEVVEKKTVTTQLACKEPKGNIADEVIKP